MKKIILLSLLFCNINSYAQTAPSWTWATTAGSHGWDWAGMDEYNTSTIATDRNGNSYITGLFNDTATFGSCSSCTLMSPSHPSIFVAKYDNSGICVWAKQFGGNDADVYGNEGMAIDIDSSGNCYATGIFHGSSGSTISFGSSTLNCTGSREIFVVKYDAAGNEIWARQPTYSGLLAPNNYANGIKTDKAGNSYVTGYLGGGGATFGSTSTLADPGAFVVKYDASGNIVFATKIGMGYFDADCISIDPSGNSFVSGYFQGSDNFATSPAIGLTSFGGRDVMVAKVSSAGSLTWVKHFGGTGGAPNIPYAYGFGIDADGNGNIFVTGKFQNNITFGSTLLSASSALINYQTFLAKLDPAGNVIWAKQSVGDASATAIKVVADGSGVITGGYSGGGMFDSTVFGSITLPQNGGIYVVEFDSSGNFNWAQTSTGGVSYARGISLDSAGGIYLAGNAQSPTTFGSSTTVAYGGFDILLAKMGADPALSNRPHGPSGVSVIKNNENNIIIHPNPNNGLFALSANKSLINASIKVMNMVGQVVMEKENMNGIRLNFDISSFPQGMYLIELNEGTTILRTKLIKN